MFRVNFVRLAFAAAMLVVSSAAAAQAQRVPGPRPRVIILPCCNCVGGEGDVVNLNSGNGAGSVPWNVSGPLVVNPIAQTITGNFHPAWTATLSPALWVHPDTANGSTNQPGGTYNYTVRFVVPDCTIPMRVSLNGQAAADDELKAFVTDQNATTTQIGATPYTQIIPPPAVAQGQGGWGFRAERIASLPWSTNVPGLYTLRLEVPNRPGTPHGLLVRAALRTICPRALVQPDGPNPG